MTRAEAYWILHEMMVETFSADQSKALSMAMDDIEFVDLMPEHYAPVVRCKDCKYQGDEDECPLLSLFAYTSPDGFCSYGELKEDNNES